MNYRNRSKSVKPSTIHNQNVEQNDVEWIEGQIQSEFQKNSNIKVNQENLSKLLSLHFKKSVGINIVEGGEKYE